MQALKRNLLAFCLIVSVMADTSDNAALQSVSQGAQLFSTNFVKTIANENQGNLICSPLSVDIALSMAAVGANGQTKKEFYDVLKLPSSEVSAMNGFKSLIDTLNDVENVTLKLANKMFIAENFQVKSEYKNNLQTYFHSDIESVDFTKSQLTADIINNWCKEKTNNRIDGIVKADTLDPTTALMLANAVYFKGNWAHKFNPEDTTDRPFHVDANTIKQVPTMYRKGNYKYAEMPEHDAKCIELPYANKEISMVIILPNQINGLAALTENLNTVLETCNTRLGQTYEREVKLYLPKFKTESKLEDLADTLSNKMGLVDAFSDKANFSGISEVPLKISKVVQKAFIEVNEEGSEAAAVTVVGIALTSLLIGKSQEFDVNRPFYYYIKYNTPHMTLFDGYVTQPKI